LGGVKPVKKRKNHQKKTVKKAGGQKPLKKKCSNKKCKNPNKDKNGFLLLSEFGIDERLKLGKTSRCSLCLKKDFKRYNNKYKTYRKRWAIKNKNRIKLQAREYYLKNKKTIMIRHRKYAEKNRKRQRNYYKNIYYPKNKQKILYKNKKYDEINKEKRLNQKYKRRKIRLKIDPNFKMKERLRSRLYEALKKQLTGKKVSAVRDLGCSMKFFIKHIESKWQPGMSWNNYGNKRRQWSLDHIKALANFDLTKKSDQKKACHYTNIQPLWHKQNIIKSNKY
jgi:hypothetical protein